MRRELVAKGGEPRAIELDGDHSRLCARLGERLAEVVDRGAVAGVGDAVPVGSHAVHADDETLVLDGTRLEERAPGMRAGGWPVGYVEQQLVVECGAAPAEDREAQVVAHERTDPEA